MSSAAPHHTPLALHLQDEEDIAHSQSWLSDNDDSEPHINASHRKGKGKGKGRSGHTDPTTPDSSSENLDKIAYPPVNEDAEETRRVEENLRRWEIAERQRRKAARGSTQSAKPSSLIEDVSKRASLLWPGRKTKHASIGGSHAALESQDHVDILPLNEVAIASPVPSPTRSDSDETHINDPFANPPELLSPFADSFQVATLAPPSDAGVDKHPSASSNANDSNASRSTAHDTLKPNRPPLPMPLNLPPPRTPPMGSPLLSPTNEADARHKESERVRWWHEWLCGCSEGPDRGGDHQAGRTNPLE